MTIHKYCLAKNLNDISPKKIIPMSSGRIYSVQKQKDSICIWAQSDDSWQIVNREFEIVPTVGNLTNINNKHFLGTVQFLNGDLVFHIFEVFK